jgi:hypothetical protein
MLNRFGCILSADASSGFGFFSVFDFALLSDGDLTSLKIPWRGRVSGKRITYRPTKTFPVHVPVILKITPLPTSLMIAHL